MSDFDDAFAAADQAAESVMGERFTYDGREFPAISIDPVGAEERAMAGGKFADASTVIYVRASVVKDANIRQNKEIVAKGEELRVLRIEHDTEGSRVVICGPVAVNIPRR